MFVVKVGVVFCWHMWLTVDMWPGCLVVVPNMVVFQDDIGALISIFASFPLINYPTLFC
jgi:hypothetical protein